MNITIENKQIHYVDEGEGPVVLLLHGWGAQAETYRLIINHLSSRCRVVAPDLPGFGSSDEPEEAWNIDQYVNFVLKFCKEIGITECTVMGHSNGGRLLIKLMAREELPLTIQKAVLIDSAGLKAKHGIDWYIRVYSYKAVKKVMMSKPMKACFPKAVEKAQEKFGSEDYRNSSPLMREVMVKMLNEDLEEYLPKIKASTLLIWGDKDTATPLADGQKMESLIPDAGLAVLEGTGHFSFAEKWGQCRAILDSFI